MLLGSRDTCTVIPSPIAARVPRGGALLATLVALAVLGMLGLLVHHQHGVMAWEQPVASRVQGLGIPNRLAEAVMLFWRPVPFALLTVGLATAAFASGRRRVAVLGAVGCLVAVGVTELVLKPIVGRSSWDGALMFPSGHATAAAAWAMFAWLVIGRGQRRYALIVVPIVVGIAVVAAHVHHPADVLGGWIVGGLAVTLVVGPRRAVDRDHTDSVLAEARADP
jgi:undecaprenyl-diphosphatase